MKSKELGDELIAWTIDHCGHQLTRDFIGLSQCAAHASEMAESRLNGFPLDNRQRLKMYAFGGAVKGHPDFLFDGLPGDCKSVNLDDHLPLPGRLPRRVFWQMQGYMLYKPADLSIVLYESRETGIIAALDVPPVRAIQDQIHAKLRDALDLLNNHKQEA